MTNFDYYRQKSSGQIYILVHWFEEGGPNGPIRYPCLLENLLEPDEFFTSHLEELRTDEDFAPITEMEALAWVSRGAGP